jgi:hypothetical protein
MGFPAVFAATDLVVVVAAAVAVVAVAVVEAEADRPDLEDTRPLGLRSFRPPGLACRMPLRTCRMRSFLLNFRWEEGAFAVGDRVCFVSSNRGL